MTEQLIKEPPKAAANREPVRGYELLSRRRGELMGIALLWVMLFHAYPFHFHVLPLDAFKAIGFGGVDIFLMLSGLGVCGSLLRRPDTPLRDFYLRRLKRIMPAFWLVVGAYSLALWGAGRIAGSTVLWNLSGVYYWFHIEGAFNWYIPALLAFYALTPLFVRMLRHSRHREWLTVGVMAGAYLLYRLSAEAGLDYTADFLYRIPVFFLGCLLAAYLLDQKPLTRRHIAVWSLCVLFGVTLQVLTLTGVYWTSICYSFALCAVPGCLILAKGLEALPWEGPRKFLRRLGECSLEIYLLNVIVTREFPFLSRFLDFDPYHLVYYAIVYSLNLVLGILLHRLIQRAEQAVKTRRVPV